MPEKKLKLLIADDHRIFMEGLQHLLVHELQAEIKGVAFNGKEAIEKCGQYDIDAIIMDINMPIIDGIHATITIKQLYPYIKVIIISTSDDINTIAHALKAGADAYVLKDEGSEDLIKAFKAISKNEIYLSSAVAHLFTNETGGLKTKKGLLQFADSFITPREQSILKLITEGYTNQEIADILFISVATADTHRKNMLSKLKLPNTAALVKFAMENRLV